MTKEKKLVIVSLFSTISALLYCFIKVPLPFFPSFLELNFSMIPIFIILFWFGFKYSVISIILRFLIKIMIISTSTAYVGELADVIIGLFTIIGLYLGQTKDKKIIRQLIFGILFWVVSACIVNMYILIPMYIKLYFNNDITILVDMCSLIKGINESNFMVKYIIYAVIPFNLLLSSIVSFFTYIVYKRTYNIFK